MPFVLSPEQLAGAETVITQTCSLELATPDEVRAARERVVQLELETSAETDPVRKKILWYRMNTTRANYYDLVPVRGHGETVLTGKKVVVAVLDGGIAAKTAGHLKDLLVGYLEMDGSFAIKPATEYHLYPMISYDRAGSEVIKQVVDHGDIMVRLLHQVAPEARILVLNNYNRERTATEAGVTFTCRVYDGPQALIKGIEYLLAMPALWPPADHPRV